MFIQYLPNKMKDDDEIAFYAFGNELLSKINHKYFTDNFENYKFKNLPCKFMHNNSNINIIMHSLSGRQKKICYSFVKMKDIAINVRLNKYYNYLKVNAIKTPNLLKDYGQFDVLIKYKNKQ